MKTTCAQAFAGRRLGPLAIIIVLAVAGCSRVSSTPSAVAAPAAQQTPSPDDCYKIAITSDGGDFSTATLERISTLVTVGVFKSYGSAAWNTPDGVRPTQDTLQSGAPVTILRPLKAMTDAALKGDTQNMVHALVRGGQVGCDSVAYRGDADLAEGARYVFFFGPISDSTGKLKGDLMLSDAWPVADDGTVTRPQEVPIALESLTALIANGPVPTPEPTPTPPPAPIESGPG